MPTARSHRSDRHGRGPRGPLLPASVPAYRTRRQVFDDHVLASVQRLGQRWAKQLAEVEFAVDEVPGSSAPWQGQVPLARVIPADASRPTTVVLYRRPIEFRVPDRSLLGPLVHELVVEQVAGVLGVEPSTIDPDVGD